MCVQAKEKTLLIYGDSLSAGYGLADLSQGWVALLEQRLREQQRPWNITNASISGETTSGGLSRLAQTLKTIQPDLVIIELGANDGLQGTSLTAMESNLEQMVAQSLDAGAQVVLFEMHIPPNYGPVYTQMFNQAFHKVAKKYTVPVLPFFLDGVAGHPQMNQPDGIHPLARAQAKILDNVWAGMATYLQ